MIIFLKNAFPYLLFFIGLISLFMINQPILACVIFLLAIVIILERIWPEEWDADKKKSC